RAAPVGDERARGCCCAARGALRGAARTMVAWAAVDAWAAAPERRRADVFLPLVVFPGERTAALEPSAAPLRDTIARYLPRVGAILCRGFRVAEDADFERFVALTAPREPRVAGRLWLW